MNVASIVSGIVHRRGLYCPCHSRTGHIQLGYHIRLQPYCSISRSMVEYPVQTFLCSVLVSSPSLCDAPPSGSSVNDKFQWIGILLRPGCRDRLEIAGPEQVKILQRFFSPEFSNLLRQSDLLLVCYDNLSVFWLGPPSVLLVHNGVSELARLGEYFRCLCSDLFLGGSNGKDFFQCRPL